MTVESISTSKLHSLNEYWPRNNAKQILPQAAKEEGIFLQSMLKSICIGQHFLDESNSDQSQSTFQDMLDGPYTHNRVSSKVDSMLVPDIESQRSEPTRSFYLNAPYSGPPEDSTSALTDDFVKSIWPKAKQCASLIGLDPKILLAQAALETGWGKFIAKDEEGLSSNNLFNIKSSSHHNAADSVKVNTTEYIANTAVKVNASFRKYPSVEQSVTDYVSLIQNSERYQKALANTGNPERYMNELHQAGYATDPNYGAKILSIYHGNELHQAMQRCGLL